jgi:starch phosphorylase
VTQSGLPERIGRLKELSQNLWWSWHPSGRTVFRTLDYPLWRLGGHNPIRIMDDVSPETLAAAAEDPTFQALYDQAVAEFDGTMQATSSWYSRAHRAALEGPVAYFSMEFALHSSLPIYAGGLGVLAGDLCKEASDLGLPMVAVGFMYPEGYFYQRISEEGWQEEEYHELDFTKAPIAPVTAPDGDRCLARVNLHGRTLRVGAWAVNLGRVNLILLDTDIEGNEYLDRHLSNRLYIAEPDQRLQQELLLGVGGVRVLRTLGYRPSVWHANEGHTAFMMAERIAEEVRKGTEFDAARDAVQTNTVFTTHTPVPAGHDVFDTGLVASYLGGIWPDSGMETGKVLALGTEPDRDGGPFNMTVLSINTSCQRNGVSKLHGDVARKMWQGLWPDLPVDKVPIIAVTNGIHTPTWLASEMRHLFHSYIGDDWLDNLDDPTTWEMLFSIPDDELWETHQLLKRKLFHIISERAQDRWAQEKGSARQVLSMGALLDHDTLTIGFVRRFAAYKRPSLIFRDIERLKRIVNDEFRPVQFVFAGKSHPADQPSKELLQSVHTMARDRAFEGRIAFLEDYDMRLARYLAQGIDVWLNVPRRLQEASGTSGMKACLNGVLHLSVPDGWWAEAYDGENGWSIGDTSLKESDEAEDAADAEALYTLLEKEVVPLFYTRDRLDVPEGWTQLMKRAMRSIIPGFSARRMLKEYCEKMYLPTVIP